MPTTEDTRPVGSERGPASLDEAACLEALIETQRAVALAAGDLPSMFDAIAEGTLRSIAAAEGVAVESRENDELFYAAVAGSASPHRGVRVPLLTTLSGRAIRESRGFVIADALLETGIDREIMLRFGIRSAVVVPVFRHGEAIGALKAHAGRPGAFGPRDLAVAQLLAGLTASAFGDAAEARSRRDLRGAEIRYRQTFDSVTEFGIVVTDRGGIVTEWNIGAERIFGWTADEMRGVDTSRFFTPEDRAADRSAIEMRHSLAQGRAIDERWHVRKDNSRFFASGNLMPLRGDAGEHLGFIKIVRDRTEQHLAGVALDESRQELERSERKWRGLFEGLQEGFVLAVVVRDTAGRIADWRFEEVNKAGAELFGLVSNDAIGRGIRGLLPGVEDEWVSELAGVVDTGRPIRFTRRIDRLGRWYDGVAQPIGNERFNILLVDASVRMAREARQSALLELGDRLRDLDDVEAAASAASAILGQVLGASRAGFGIVNAETETVDMRTDWCAPGVRSVAGTHAFRDFGSFVNDLKRGDPAIVLDVTIDPRTRDHADAFAGLGIRTLANIPILARGQLVAIASVHFAQEHDWAQSDTTFLREVADRTQLAIARIQAEAGRQILNRELAHRLKNTLAIVQSIATQTLRAAPDTSSARKTLTDRIQALSKAHDILLSGQREAAPLREIVRQASALHDEGGRVRLSGPDIALGPKASLTLSLIVHELATNAGKYGALAVEEGHVEVTWSTQSHDESGRPILVLDWHEIGGPPVSPPTRKSFGTRLVEMGLSGAVDGSSQIVYAPEGLRCRLTASLVELQSESGN